MKFVTALLILTFPYLTRAHETGCQNFSLERETIDINDNIEDIGRLFSYGFCGAQELLTKLGQVEKSIGAVRTTLESINQIRSDFKADYKSYLNNIFTPASSNICVEVSNFDTVSLDARSSNNFYAQLSIFEKQTRKKILNRAYSEGSGVGRDASQRLHKFWAPFEAFRRVMPGLMRHRYKCNNESLFRRFDIHWALYGRDGIQDSLLEGFDTETASVLSFIEDFRSSLRTLVEQIEKFEQD